MNNKLLKTILILITLVITLSCYDKSKYDKFVFHWSSDLILNGEIIFTKYWKCILGEDNDFINYVNLNKQKEIEEIINKDRQHILQLKRGMKYPVFNLYFNSIQTLSETENTGSLYISFSEYGECNMNLIKINGRWLFNGIQFYNSFR